ncbi:MAG: hypothetical protein ACFB10_03795 [Salibacteraceae bacterium]
MLQKIIALLLLAGAFTSPAHSAEVFKWNGTHNGSTYKIPNPKVGIGNKRCISKIWLNNRYVYYDAKADTILLDLPDRIGMGEALSVDIEHESWCTPLVKVETPKFSQAHIDSMYVRDDGLLVWTATYGVGTNRLPFVAQQWNAGTWRTIAVPKVGEAAQEVRHEVKVNLAPGTNYFRIGEMRPNQASEFQEVMYDIMELAPTAKLEDGMLRFSQPLDCQVYWVNSSVPKKDTVGSAVDISDLKRGTYTVYYGNRKADMVWKRGGFVLINPQEDSPSNVPVAPRFGQTVTGQVLGSVLEVALWVGFFVVLPASVGGDVYCPDIPTRHEPAPPPTQTPTHRY